MAWVFTVREIPLIRFSFDDGGKLPFYKWVGSPKVTDTSVIPTSATQQDKLKLKDAFIVDHAAIISDKFRQVIESVEPGVHEFFPIVLKHRDGTPYDELFFIIHVTSIRKCVFYQRSGKRGEVWTVAYGDDAGHPVYDCQENMLVVSRPAIAGRHLLSTRLVAPGYCIVSDELGRRMKAARISNLRMYPVAEVDEPWIAESDVPEYVEWLREHPERASNDL